MGVAGTKFSQLNTQRVADRATEEVLRSLRIAVEELRAETRAIRALPRCVGVASYTMSAVQTISGAGAKLQFSVEGQNTAGALVTHSAAEYEWTLRPGYVYALRSSFLVSDAGGYLGWTWYDETNAAAIGVRGFAPTTDRAADDSGQSVGFAAVAPAETIRVSCQSVFVAGATDVNSDYSWASIEVFKP